MNNQSGFSIIGTLIAVGIFGIISASTAALFKQMTVLKATQQFTMDLDNYQKEMRAVLSAVPACTGSLGNLRISGTVNADIRQIKNADDQVVIRASNSNPTVVPNTVLGLRSVFFETSDTANDQGVGRIRLEIEALRTVYGPSRVVKYIDVQTVRDSGTRRLIECVALSEMSDGIWQRRPLATVRDVYFEGGSVGIGVQEPVSILDVNGDASVRGDVVAQNYFHSSDRNLKANIKTSPGLSIIEKLRGTNYQWSDDGTPSAGVIAQEVEKVLPHAVRTGPDGLKAVDYDALIAPLIEAVKEQQREIISLKKRLSDVEKKSR